MIRELGKYMSDSPGAKTKGEHYLFWCELRDKLNNLGPPTRNITEWKKVDVYTLNNSDEGILFNFLNTPRINKGME